MVSPLMKEENPNMSILRSRATELAGLVAVAIGKEEFAPYLNYFMNQALQVCFIWCFIRLKSQGNVSGRYE